jgi:hypothetical chaperone protein
VQHAVIDIPELNLRLPFSREQLDIILEPVLRQLRESIVTVLGKAGIGASQVDVVIRTGGSSEIVAVRNLLEELFPGKVVGHDPFTSVACGLAIANYHGHW